MTSAEKHIRHFNLMNGNDVTKKTLQKFLSQVPKTPELKTLRSKLSKAIDQMTDNESAELRFKPLKYRQVVSKVNLSGVDASLLYGLQNIQNDSEFADKNLNGINDTTYKVITDRILELIKAGGLIWRKPWNSKVNGDTDLAHNHQTRHIYRGANFYLNYLVKYSSPAYFTFKQVDALGGKVKAGERGWPVIYFKWLYKDKSAGKLVPEDVATINGKVKPGYDAIPGLFYYTVFNYDQCEGITINRKPAVIKTAQQRIESAENIIEMMPKRPPTKYDGDRAFYMPSEDRVQIPPIKQFKQAQHFYSVQFHEYIHSTGHKSRVGRDLSGSFGSKNYAFEELIAELGASFLCGESGILYFTMNNSAAYIDNWSGKLRKEMEADPKFFLRAAAAAQKAADFMLAIGEYEYLKVNKRAKSLTTRTAVPRTKKKVSAKKKNQNIPAETMDGPHSRKRGKRSGKKPAAALAGFTTADQTPEHKDIFRLPGVMGDLLGDLQRYKLEIVVSGETHSGKSELGKQLANAFVEAGFKTGYIDWEQGGLSSKDTTASLTRNMTAENRKKLFISSDLPKTLDAVKSLHSHFDVVIIDSGTKLKQTTNAWIDELREEYPGTIWIPLMQQNEKGGTRGGSAAEFDAPVVIKTYRPNRADFRQNYAVVEKNRGNKTDVMYNIAAKQIVNQNAPVPA